MYSYSAGSPGTFSGPRPIDARGPGYGLIQLTPRQQSGLVPAGRGWRNVGRQFVLPKGVMAGMGTYLQMGHRLSYAPRFSGMGAFDQAKYDQAVAQGLPPAEAYKVASGEESTGGGWADAINAAITGVASIFTISQQAKLAKQQQHQMERDAAAAAELAKTQALYLQSQSIKPAQGTSVMIASGAPAGRGGMGGTAMLLGGVAVAGLAAYMLMGRKK